MSTPPFRVLPSTMTSPARAALARTYSEVEGALHAMGEGIVVDARDHLVAFSVSMPPRFAEAYVAKIKARDEAAAARATETARREVAGEPTRDQSYCDVGRHLACSGYTEDEGDPETCMCFCHDPDPTGGA